MYRENIPFVVIYYLLCMDVCPTVSMGTTSKPTGLENTQQIFGCMQGTCYNSESLFMAVAVKGW